MIVPVVDSLSKWIWTLVILFTTTTIAGSIEELDHLVTERISHLLSPLDLGRLGSTSRSLSSVMQADLLVFKTIHDYCPPIVYESIIRHASSRPGSYLMSFSNGPAECLKGLHRYCQYITAIDPHRKLPIVLRHWSRLSLLPDCMEIQEVDAEDTIFHRAEVEPLMALLEAPSSTLKVIKMDVRDLKENHASLLAEALEKNTQLESLTLGNFQFDDDSVAILVQALKTNRHLSSLSLTGGVIGVHGVDALVGFLSSNVAHSKLRALNLAQNRFAPESGRRRLLQSLLENQHVQSLNLAGTHLDTEDAVVVAQLLAQNMHLRRLILHSNKIRSQGAVELVDALKGSPESKLTELDLRLNEIGSVGIFQLAEYLETLHPTSRLARLHLAHNDIGFRAALFLAQTIAGNSNVELLDLRENGLDAFARGAIYRVLNERTDLKLMV